MEELVYFITQGSSVVDAVLLVRLVILMMGMELFTTACGLIGGMKR